jgi:antirestriction protein ArdC
MSKVNVYQIVTDRIIAELEKGTIPWQRPFTSAGMAVNWKTQRPYRGINQYLLPEGEYATFQQVTEAGGHVKKGEKSHLVVLWKFFKEVNENGEETGKKIPWLKGYNVFEINTQCEGLSSKRKEETYEHDPIQEAEKVVQNYMNAPEIRYSSGRAYYHPALDYVNMPPMIDFKQCEEFYCVMFHELAHSTGHKSRLNRPGITGIAAFGSETYSKEELVAEMTAAMLCGTAGIENTYENSAAYIASWLKALKSDNKMIVQAAAQAQKAADYILGVKWEDE